MRVHPITKATIFHNGIDIACPVGTPVKAPADGVITQVWEHETGGKSIAMEAGNVRFGFAHLSSQLKKIGDRVKNGEPIALSGNTGKSTGPHLHFTVKIDGDWKNPKHYFNYE